jgi:hypothetical protein
MQNIGIVRLLLRTFFRELFLLLPGSLLFTGSSREYNFLNTNFGEKTELQCAGKSSASNQEPNKHCGSKRVRSDRPLSAPWPRKLRIVKNMIQMFLVNSILSFSCRNTLLLYIRLPR